MNGKDLKLILPLAVVVVIILAILGVAMMNVPKDNKSGKETGPYEMSVGPITDSEDNPVVGAVITLQDEDGNVNLEVTDEYGNAKFSFDEKIDAGEYVILIKHDDFEQIEMNVTLDYNGKDITLTGIDTDENIVLSPKVLPPLEMIVGPIYNGKGMLEGVEVTLKLVNETISTVYTDKNGFTKFIFNTPPSDGIYIINVSIENYTSIEFEISLSYDEEDHKLDYIGDLTYIELEKIIPPPLPPLEFYIGPISGAEGVLEGVKVGLKLDDALISTVYTDVSGYAKFSFETPPEGGTYVLAISYAGYEDTKISVILTYNEELHVLSVSGDITDITIEKIVPPEPENDPDYYKELDEYKELEGAKEEPVDVKTMLDEDSDGTPEYYEDIQTATGQEVGIDEYVSLDDNGDPEYSPEIATYVPIEEDEYLQGSGRSGTRSGTEPAGTSSSRSRAVNLTHYNDIVEKNMILDNGTTEILNYETNAVNFDHGSEFSEEVSQVGVLIKNSLAVGFINGTNATDQDNDGNPERVVTWKVVTKLVDRNNDNKTDHKVVAVQILEAIDNNSNGVFEHGKGFSAVMIAYDNDYNGQFENVKYAVAAGEQATIDGNITEHFVNYGIFYNHTIDKNNDSNYEFQRAAVYIVQSFDNNSNGHFELHREFAGGIEAIDNNSNGKYEKALIIWAGKVLYDKNDNGLEDVNISIMWIYYAEDQNEDKILEKASALMMSNWYFDNNSNGNYEFKREVIAGLLVVDSDSDGKPEKMDAVKAVNLKLDKNDDGVMDANISIGQVFLWTDANEDTNPESQHALIYIAWTFDNNSNGNPEFSREAITGFSLQDNNSDGNINELYALRYCVDTIDTNDNGSVNHNRSFAYALHFKDADDDGNIEYKHAIFGYEYKWDNNSDGKYEAINQLAAGYEYEDDDDDGKVDNETFFILVNKTIDKNNDGNPEVMLMRLMASRVQYADNGTIIRARNVFIQTLAYDNNSNGNIDVLIQIILGQEGFNGIQNGTKIDWETEHVLLIIHGKKDTDDNGTWDAQATFIKVEI